jgi:hypothetical protein
MLTGCLVVSRLFLVQWHQPIITRISQAAFDPLAKLFLMKSLEKHNTKNTYKVA